MAKGAAAAVMRVLTATSGDSGVEAAADIIELALHEVVREQEKKELKRIAAVQADAHAYLSRLLNASPAVIYCQCKAVCACDCELISGRRCPGYAVRVRLCS